MTRPERTCSILVALALAGCAARGSGSIGFGQAKPGAPENTAAPVNALDDPAHPGLESCTSGLSSEEIEAELAIVRAFEQSLHEMIICGGLTVSYSVSFVDVLVNTALSKGTSPKGFRHLGGGRYDAGGIMVVSLHLPYDTSFGQTGDIIPFDVFDPASYFTGLRAAARATVDIFGNTSTELQLGFSETKPGFELLGAAATTESSITLDFDQMVEALGQVQVRSRFEGTSDQVGDVTVKYMMQDAGAVTVADLIHGGTMSTELMDVTATRESSAQRIEVTRWAMEYGGGSAGTLDGEIEFRVVGGAFPYTAHFVYPHRKSPDVTLGCEP